MGFFDWLTGKPPTREKFARIITAELNRRKIAHTYDADAYRIHLGVDHHWNLHNAHQEYCAVSKLDRAQVLDRFIGMLSTIPEDVPNDFEIAKANLRPRLWMKGSMAQMRLQVALDGGNSDFQLDEVSVGSHMLATIVYDLPTAVKTVSSEQLAEWGTTHYLALEIALANLEQVPFQVATVGEGFYICDNSDSYDASRLLMPKFVERLEVKGDLIAMTPNRDLLLIAGSDDDAALEHILALTEQALKRPRPMSGIAMRREGTDWVDWLPSRGHRLYDRFKLLEIHLLMEEYSWQKELLNKLHEKEGTDVFVAQYSALTMKDGEAYSYCVWSKGVESLLPRTDKVFFFEDGKEIVAEAKWGQVMKVVGELLVSDDDLYPPRFWTAGYPTPEQISDLKSDRDT